MPRYASNTADSGIAKARTALRNELTRLQREAARLETALQALGGPGRPRKTRRRRRRGPGRPPKRRGPGRPPKNGRRRGPGRPPKRRGPGRPPKNA